MSCHTYAKQAWKPNMHQMWYTHRQAVVKLLRRSQTWFTVTLDPENQGREGDNHIVTTYGTVDYDEAMASGEAAQSETKQYTKMES